MVVYYLIKGLVGGVVVFASYVVLFTWGLLGVRYIREQNGWWIEKAVTQVV